LVLEKREIKAAHEKFRKEESVDAYFHRLTESARAEGDPSSAKELRDQVIKRMDSFLNSGTIADNIESERPHIDFETSGADIALTEVIE
jgi:hypothetical protein